MHPGMEFQQGSPIVEILRFLQSTYKTSQSANYTFICAKESSSNEFGLRNLLCRISQARAP